MIKPEWNDPRKRLAQEGRDEQEAMVRSIIAAMHTRRPPPRPRSVQTRSLGSFTR